MPGAVSWSMFKSGSIREAVVSSVTCEIVLHMGTQVDVYSSRLIFHIPCNAIYRVAPVMSGILAKSSRSLLPTVSSRSLLPTISSRSLLPLKSSATEGSKVEHYSTSVGQRLWTKFMLYYFVLFGTFKIADERTILSPIFAHLILGFYVVYRSTYLPSLSWLEAKISPVVGWREKNGWGGPAQAKVLSWTSQSSGSSTYTRPSAASAPPPYGCPCEND